MNERRVHKVEAPTRFNTTCEVLETYMNEVIAKSEKITSVNYIDGYWWITTDDYGLPDAASR